MNLVKIAVCFLNQWQTRQAARWMKGRHAEVVGGRRRRSRHAGNAQTSGSRQNGRRLWREGFWLVGALGGGGARARPPVFPRTMPNGAFVKVSSFTADAARAPRVSDYRSLVRFAPIEGRQKAADSYLTRFAPKIHSLASTLQLQVKFIIIEVYTSRLPI